MTVGFIGTGNMGGALAAAAAKAIGGGQVRLCDRDAAKAAALAAQLGAQTASVDELVEACDYVFLGVKPQGMSDALKELRAPLFRRQTACVLVSMAAGLSTDALLAMLGQPCPLIRIMPNTPAAVGEGMILYTCTDRVEARQRQAFTDIMACAGRLCPIEERLMDAASAVSGCGPAFAYLFIEALADGGVECGLPRAQALELAAQTVLGAAKMVQQTGRHPGVLKDAVCSPGGTTIAGVHALEDGAFRATAMEAVCAAYQRTLELGK